jgi:hypothetical protein
MWTEEGNMLWLSVPTITAGAGEASIWAHDLEELNLPWNFNNSVEFMKPLIKLEWFEFNSSFNRQINDNFNNLTMLTRLDMGTKFNQNTDFLKNLVRYRYRIWFEDQEQ